MPSDPDNKMDELLKSYAKKRQDEAGAPGEMHPATRRLLQAEITKLRPEPSAPKVPWWQNLVMIWPRLAFAAGVFVALGMATWSLIDTTKQSSSESQLAKQEPSVAEKAITFADDRESLRDEKARVAEPARPAKEADPQSRLVEDRIAAGGGLGGREVDALSKQKAAEVAKAEGAATRERYYRSVVPSAPAPSVPPPAPNKPAMLADQEVRQLAVADTPAPQPTSTRRTAPGEVRTKDAGTAASATKSIESLGKNLALNEEVKLGLAPASASLKGRDANLAFSLNNQPGNAAVTANSVIPNADGIDALRLKNNETRLPGGVIPPTSTQPSLGNTANSLDAFYAANQNKVAANVQAPKLQLDLNDNSGQGLANNREVLLRQNNYDQQTTAAPTAQTPPAESKRDQVSLAGTKVDTDKAVRELNEAVPARADNYANRGVTQGQPAQNAALYRQRFAQVPASGQSTVFKKVSAPTTKVLSNFEVQRNGGQVRVVDADGSVYDGQVVADAGALAASQAVATDESRSQIRRSENRPAQTPALQQAAASEADGQNWAFRVSGTNRTLRQPVSLEGVMQVGQYQNQAPQSQIANRNGQSPTSAANAPQQLGRSNLRAGQAAGPAAAYNEQLSNASQLSVTNASPLGAQRIQGRLRVGPNNQIELEAVPADN